MTFKEWLTNKGADVAIKEIRQLCAPIAEGNISLDGDDGFNFLVEFEDGSYLTEPDIDLGEVGDRFDSTALLKEIADYLYNDYVELQNSMEFTYYQKNFILKLVDWKDHF